MLFTNDESSSKHSSRIDHGTWALSWDSSWWCLKTNVSVPNSNRVSTVSLYHLDLSSAIQVDHPRWFLPKYDGLFTPKIHRCHGTIRGNYGQFGPSKLICPGVTWFFPVDLSSRASCIRRWSEPGVRSLVISGDCNGFVRKYDIPKSIGKSSFSLSTLPLMW